jgi:hypothetical protein
MAPELQIEVTPEAKFALESLPPDQRRAVRRRIDTLTPPRTGASRGLYRLKVPGEVFSLKATPEIRVIFSRRGQSLVVTHIVRRETLRKLFRQFLTPAKP